MIKIDDDLITTMYSLGDFARYYREKMSTTPNFYPFLRLNVYLNYDDDTGKYSPAKPLPLGGSTETIDFTYDYENLIDKYKSRYMTARVSKDELTPTTAMELHADLFNKWSRFCSNRRYDISNRISLMLNQYDPLYNYDRYEVYDENVTTDYKGAELNNVEYLGSEKNRLKQNGIEQIGVESYNLDKQIGKEVNEHDVTGYNVGDYSHDTRDTTSYVADTQSLATVNQTLVRSSDVDGEVVGRITNTSGTPATGKANAVKSDSLQTRTFDGRSDTSVKSFDNRKDNSIKSFEDRQDETQKKTNNHLYGNIGVTTSMQLVREQYQLGELFRFFDNLVKEFVNEYTIVI